MQKIKNQLDVFLKLTYQKYYCMVIIFNNMYFASLKGSKVEDNAFLSQKNLNIFQHSDLVKSKKPP